MTRVTVNRCISSSAPLAEEGSASAPELPAQEPEAQELEELYCLPPKDRAALHLTTTRILSQKKWHPFWACPQLGPARLARARAKLKLFWKENLHEPIFRLF